MARNTQTKATGVKMTQSEYDYLVSQAEDAERRVLTTQEELQMVAQDGIDDENPAYAQVKESLAIATQAWNSLREKVASAVVVEPTNVIEGVVSEHAKKIMLRCIYAPDDECERTFNVGHNIGDVTPASPLFKFLCGKSVGYKGTFVNNTDRGIFSYDIEILGVEF